ncbi:MAG TPA: UDP-N-acetylmuramoyl-L-alanine--D-glutamate ligase [Firmicutes bacterium]|nr:UDP-N-acetylmuramoyl-L-alanine--D-glutamate ligase [Bacillota bacterium]
MQSILQEFIRTLQGKRVAVVGIGVSNTPLIERLLEGGVSVLACDRREREQFHGQIERWEAQGLEARLGADYLDGLDGADVIFRTPGLRPDVPQLARAVERGAKLTSEMEAFLALCPCQVIAVTGSDGKTTTTTIIAGLLRDAGYRTFVGGNIGHPLLCEVDQIPPDAYVVLELSSFQLLTMRQSPNVAVITNLSPNHLDVHRDMEEYVQAKRNIFAYQEDQDRLVLNADQPLTASFAQQAKGRVTLFSRQRTLEGGVCLRDGMIFSGGRPVLAASDILLPGVHNLENYLAAIAAVEGLVSSQTIQDFARHFPGVEHRIELVRERAGVRWYNDSIASSPTRTMAGLRCFSTPVILLAGGYDKNLSYDALGPEIVNHVKVLILTGQTADKIQEATQNSPGYRPGRPEIVRCDTLEAAVARANELARPGDAVLLSPASASFDQFENFAQRGRAFKDYVRALEPAEGGGARDGQL